MILLLKGREKMISGVLKGTSKVIFSPIICVMGTQAFIISLFFIPYKHFINVRIIYILKFLSK